MKWDYNVYAVNEVFFIGHDLCEAALGYYYSDVTWASLHLKPLAAQLFVQKLVWVNTKDNVKAPHSWLFFEGNPPVTVGFPSQRASNVESVSMSLHLHAVPTWSAPCAAAAPPGRMSLIRTCGWLRLLEPPEILIPARYSSVRWQNNGVNFSGNISWIVDPVNITLGLFSVSCSE